MLLLSVLPNALPHNRYGFIVTRRLGKAVERNRLRRRLRELLRLLHPQLQQGYDLVIIARSGSRRQSYAGLEKRLRALLVKARLLNAV